MSHDRHRKPSSSSDVPGIVFTPSRGGRPGGKSVQSVYGGLPPRRAGHGAESVQRKEKPSAADRGHPIRNLGRALSRVGHRAVDDWFVPGGQLDEEGSTMTPMPAAASAPVQRKVIDEMDAPKADSIRDERTTIDPEAGAAARPHGMRDLNRAGGLTREDLASDVPGHDGAAVADMDAPKADSIREDRATIEDDAAGDVAGPLSPEQAAHARRRNRHTTAVYHVRPADLDTSAAPDTPAFAQAVARFQQAQGLTVDGIVGPKTVAALHETGRHTEAAAAPGAAGAESRPHASLLQMKQAADAAPDADVPSIAAAGVAGPGQPLPHAERIQASFGAHDVTGVQAHVGGAAADAARNMGALAYATGSDVAFDGTPDLHTAAHEAAHVVQQRGGGGLQLNGGVGQVGDAHEQHADAVADKVVRGESAEALLDAYAGRAESATSSRAAAGVQGRWHPSEHGATQPQSGAHGAPARGPQYGSEDPNAWDAEYKKTDKSFGLVFNECTLVAGIWRDKASVISAPPPDWKDLLLDVGSLALGGVLGHVGGLLSRSLEPELSANVFRMVTTVGDSANEILGDKTKEALKEAHENQHAKREALYAFCWQQGELLNWASNRVFRKLHRQRREQGRAASIDCPTAPHSPEQRAWCG